MVPQKALHHKALLSKKQRAQVILSKRVGSLGSVGALPASRWDFSKQRNPPVVVGPGVMEPTVLDILLGRSKDCFHHPGNQTFRLLIADSVDRYTAGPSKRAKMDVVVSLLDLILDGGGRFLKKGPNNHWYEVENRASKEKISHALRDLMNQKMHRRTSASRTQGLFGRVSPDHSSSSEHFQGSSPPPGSQHSTTSDLQGVARKDGASSPPSRGPDNVHGGSAVAKGTSYNQHQQEQADSSTQQAQSLSRWQSLVLGTLRGPSGIPTVSRLDLDVSLSQVCNARRRESASFPSIAIINQQWDASTSSSYAKASTAESYAHLGPRSNTSLPTHQFENKLSSDDGNYSAKTTIGNLKSCSPLPYQEEGSTSPKTSEMHGNSRAGACLSYSSFTPSSTGQNNEAGAHDSQHKIEPIQLQEIHNETPASEQAEACLSYSIFPPSSTGQNHESDRHDSHHIDRIEPIRLEDIHNDGIDRPMRENVEGYRDEPTETYTEEQLDDMIMDFFRRK